MDAYILDAVMQPGDVRKAAAWLALALAMLLTFAACAPSGLPSDPAEFTTLNEQRALQLGGVWQLVRLKDGRAPAPHERKTLTFQGGGTLLLDLWEHRLTFRYEVAPDSDHLRLTWVASTNPNDKPGETLVQEFVVSTDNLILDGEQFTRVALANGATLTPPVTGTEPPEPTVPATKPPEPTILGTEPPASPPVGPTVVVTATAPAATSGPVALDQPFVVRMGQSVAVPDAGVRVSLTGVVEDSRCPRNVDCFWAGRAQLSFQLDGAERSARLTLSTQPPDGRTRAYWQGLALELVSVEPYPVYPDVKIAPEEYNATVVVRKTAPPTTAKLNEPLVLKAGSSGQSEGENLRVTFLRVASDSRCPIQATCVTRGNAVVEATLETPDGEKQSFSLNSDAPTGATRTPDEGPYGIELLALTPWPRAGFASGELAPGEYEATFVVRRAAGPSVPGTAAAPVACLGLQSADAQAVLGVPAAASPTSGIVLATAGYEIKPPAIGLCGWLGIESGVAPESPGEPRVQAPRAAAYALTADRLTGGRALELLRIADIIRAAAPEADSTPYYILQTRIAAGDWDPILESLPKVAGGSKAITVEPVENLGEGAVWIARPGELAHYYALIIRTQDGFVVLEALAPADVKAEGARESLLALAARIPQ